MIRFSSHNKMLASRREKEGKWVKLYPGIYSDAPDENIDDQIRKDLPNVFRHLGWNGVLAYKSALPNSEKEDMEFFVNSPSTNSQVIKIGNFTFKRFKGNNVELMTAMCPK